MMHKILLVLIVSSFLKTSTNKDFSRQRIKSSTNQITGSSTNYFYDKKGHIQKVESSNKSVTTYTYQRGSVIKKFYNSKTGVTSFDTLYLDNTNKVTAISSPNGLTHQRIFDSTGHLTETRTFLKDRLVGRTTRAWENENLKSIATLDESGKTTSQIIYSYYPDKLTCLSEENMGRDFMGNDSKNLIKETIGISSVTSKVDTFFSISTYTFYDNGAVKTKTVSSKEDIKLEEISYEYY